MDGLDDIDAVSLQQALATIDDWEIDVVSLLDDHVDNEPASPPPSATKRRDAAPYKPRHYVVRKRELTELRAQIESLQRVLVSQQERASQQVDADAATESAVLKHECKEIVTRQYRARFLAQMRNHELRKLVEENKRDAQKIERLGRKMLAMERRMPRGITFTIAGFDGPREDPHIQLRRLPGLRHEADAMFVSGAFAEHRSDRLKTFREVALRDALAMSGTVEIVFETAWVLPFPVEDVANALWIQTTRVTTGSNQIQWLDIHADPSSVVSQFLSLPLDDPSQSTKCGQIATHRERSNDGTAQIVSNVQVKAMKGPTSIGMYNSDVWARVEPISQSADCPLSQVLWCRRVRLQPPAEKLRTPGDRGQWMQHVLSGSMRSREESMITCNMQAVENLLVSKGAKA